MPMVLNNFFSWCKDNRDPGIAYRADFGSLPARLCSLWLPVPVCMYALEQE